MSLALRSGRRGLRPRRSADFVWGFVTQVCSSGTNFGLTLLAARLLGPAGLGVVFIGFAAYQLVQGLQRAILTQPLIAHAAARDDLERRRLAGSALTVVVATGVTASGGFAVAGLIAGGDTGRGLVLFAPWLVAALLQEFWKAVLFQEGRARAGAISDATRFLVMVAAVPVVAAMRTDTAVVGVWGVASVIGFIAGAASLRPRLGPAREALVWLRGDAWLLGRWLGAREVVYQVATYSTILILVAVIGSKDLGGLRAAESLFSPFSFIAAAFLLPALPALSRAVVKSRERALRLTLRISATAVLLGALYLVSMIFFGAWLLEHLFGQSFSPYRELIWPFAVSQLLYAGSFAFTILLTAERRGRELFVVGVVGGFATISLATVFAGFGGVLGAAWGLTFASAVLSALVIAFAINAPSKQGTSSGSPVSS